MLVFGDLVWIPFTFSIQVWADKRRWSIDTTRVLAFELKYIQEAEVASKNVCFFFVSWYMYVVILFNVLQWWLCFLVAKY